jgi:hypothetical protein
MRQANWPRPDFTDCPWPLFSKELEQPWQACQGFLQILPTFSLILATIRNKQTLVKTEINLSKFTDYRTFLLAHVQDMRKRGSLKMAGLMVLTEMEIPIRQRQRL